MKGSLRRSQFFDYSKNKTNFNDWNDPKCKPLKKIYIQRETFENETSVPVESPQEIQNIIKSDNFSSEYTEEIEELRGKIREGKPLLGLKEIRIFKLPFHESLLLNLIDAGFRSTHAFINELISLDEKLCEGKDTDHVIKNRPLLKSKPFALSALSDGLIKAELANKAKEENLELRSMLDLAIHFNSMEGSWHWIAEELYEQCIDICNNEALTDKLDKELVAISKHLYAKFLVESLHNLNYALVNIEQSLTLSRGEFWKANYIVGKSYDILYFESCLLLHKIYLEMALEERAYDIEKAIHLCRNALHWATEINCKSAEATALLNLVIIYLAANKLDPVISHLENYMKLCKEQNDKQGLCEGHILFATYHEVRNQDEQVVFDVLDLLKVAEENKIDKMIALAHRKLATVFLMQGKVESMQQHAIKAYNYYVKLNSKLEMEETRCLTGLAQAQEIMSQYLDIVLKAENIEVDEFDSLMHWKSLRIPFFSNTQLFQPESEVNSNLKARVNTLKNEEMSSAQQTREAEMAVRMSIRMSKYTLRKVSLGTGIRFSSPALTFR